MFSSHGNRYKQYPTVPWHKSIVQLSVSSSVVQSKNYFSPHCINLVSYPGLLTPVLVACRTNVEESLINSSHVMMYLDIGWMCGGVTYIFLLQQWDSYYVTNKHWGEMLGYYNPTLDLEFVYA